MNPQVGCFLEFSQANHRTNMDKPWQTQIESQLVNPKIDVWPLVYWSREPFPLAISTIFGRIPPMIKSTTWLNRSQPVGTLVSLKQSSSQTGSRVWRRTCGGNPWLGTPRKFWYCSGSPKFQQSHHVIWSGYGVSMCQPVTINPSSHLQLGFRIGLWHVLTHDVELSQTSSKHILCLWVKIDTDCRGTCVWKAGAASPSPKKQTT